MMEGEIGVESKKGLGSTFWFTIPFAKEARAAEAQVTPAAPSIDRIPGNPFVLVVEDSPLIQLLASKQLGNLGVQVNTVSTGKRAVEAVRDFQYDLILMDCQMPEMDGFEATKAIRELQSSGSNRTPIIAMTASAMAGDEEKCLDAGMDDYLAKPFTVQTLRAKLIKWLPIRTDSFAV
jgi:CheY-like chemotaxis protein